MTFTITFSGNVKATRLRFEVARKSVAVAKRQVSQLARQTFSPTTGVERSLGLSNVVPNS